MEKIGDISIAEERPSRKAEMKTEFGALRRDWFEKKGIDIEGKKYSEIKEAIRLFYKENETVLKETLEADEDTLTDELGALSRKHLDHEKVAILREKLNLPKWVSLAETVAFVKTVLDTDDTQIQEKYVEYCAAGISLDDMRNVLAYENDVKPARLDTDIYHQSPNRSRSVVEIASNAIDAVNPSGNSIGRFGVGFYQILSHLKSEKDEVVVTTGTDEDGFYEIGFRLIDNEIRISLKETEVPRKNGTTVRLKSEGYPKEEADKILRKHLAFNNVANVSCDNELVNDLSHFGIESSKRPTIKVSISDDGYTVEDDGKGMSPQVILEKLIVPKFSGKKPVHELVDLANAVPTYLIEKKEVSDDTSGVAVINVGGVTIEKISLEGINLPKTIIIDLPSFTNLGEERNRVAVDEVTITAFMKLVDSVTESGDIQTINALAQIAAHFQEHSVRHNREDNLVDYLRAKLDEKLVSSDSYLPNIVGFDRVEVENAVLIDPNIKSSPWGTIKGFEAPELTGSGISVFVAPLKEKVGEPIVRFKNKIILDKKTYETFKNDPTLLNLYLEAYGKGDDADIKTIKEGGSVRERIEQRRYDSFDDYILKNWNLLGMKGEGTARHLLDHMKDDRKRMAENAFLYVGNVLPEELSKYVIAAALSPYSSNEKKLTPDKLEIIARLSRSPEFLKLLVDFDIHPFDVPEPMQRIFRDLKSYPYESSDDTIYERGGTSWSYLEYRDKNNLVHEGGKAYPGENIKFFEPLGCFYVFSEGRGRFFDPVKMDFISLELPTTLKQGGPDSVEEFMGKKYITFKFGEFGNPGEYGQECALFDFETGKPFNPKPELGQVYKFNDGKYAISPFIIFRKKLAKANEDQKYVYHVYFESGEVKEINEFKRDNPGVFEKGEREEPFLEREVENNTIIFKANGKEFLRKEAPESILQAFARKEFNSYYTVDQYLGHKYNVATLEEKGKKYLLVQAFEENTWRSHYGDQKGDSFGALYDENGVQLFQLAKDEKIISSEHVTKDGRKVFVVAEFGDFTSESVQFSSIDLRNLKKFRTLDYQGKEVSVEEIKGGLLDITFKGNGTQGESYSEDVKFCIIPGDSWKIKFDKQIWQGKRYKRKDLEEVLTPHVVAQIVGKEDGKPIIDERFRSVIYNPNTKNWECTAVDTVLGNDGNLYRDVYCIDTEGNVKDRRNVADYEIPNKLSTYYSFYDRGLEHIKQDFSDSQIASMRKALEKAGFDNPEHVERFLTRAYKFNHLKDENFAEVVDTFLILPSLDQKFLEDSIISGLSIRLKEFDESTRLYFYRFIHKMTPPLVDEKGRGAFVERFLKVYKDKIAHLSIDKKEELYKTFDSARNYNDEYFVNGWNIVRYGTKIPSHLVPENIRPIVDYLQMTEGEALAETKEAITFSQPVEFTLSKLIQAKRLNETAIQGFRGGVASLKEIVDEKTNGKAQDHIQREIIHPIYYQGVDSPYLFIRELVQNAHDAVLMDQSGKEKNVLIDIFARADKKVTLRIEDPVGMSLARVINYFLIPGETSKLDEEDTIGYFGQGLFTLFRGAEEVVLKTSEGDGVISKLHISPLKNDKGMIIDLTLRLGQEEGDYKGTTIERTDESDFPEIEAAYIKNAVATFTSLVDTQVINIKLNSAKINSKLTPLSSIDVPEYGKMTLYDAPNNVVTQRGLFVKVLDDDFDCGLRDVEELLSRHRYVLNIPDSISLTRSRNEIAGKENVLTNIKEKIASLKVAAYIEIFRQDLVNGHFIQLDNLPSDYFYYPYTESREIKDDAERLTRGESVQDPDKYLDKGSIVSLLVLLPLLELDGKSWSIKQLKYAALEDKSPLENEEKYEKIPKSLRKKLLEGKKQRNQMDNSSREADQKGEVVEDFKFEDRSNQPYFIRALFEKDLSAYGKMVNLLDDINGRVSKSLGRPNPVETTFYHEPNSAAHAVQGFGTIGWNLSYWKDWSMRGFKLDNSTFSQLRHFYDVWSHEFGHILEKSGSFTHNPSFYKKQAEALSRLMHHNILEQTNS